MALPQLHTNPARVREIAQWVCDSARVHQQAEGTRIFRSLPAGAAEALRTTRFADPFKRRMTFDEVVQWYDDHIVFDDEGYTVALWAGNEVLWREDRNDRS